MVAWRSWGFINPVESTPGGTMKVVATQRAKYTGIPDYFKIYQSWKRQHEKAGSNYSNCMVNHYARLAEEFGQAIIIEATTEVV
jgi:hypothetical protein